MIFFSVGGGIFYFPFHSEVGEICGDDVVRYDGYCMGSINSRQANGCDAIFSQGSQPLKITSQATQDFIANNFKKLRIGYASEYIIGLRAEMTEAGANRSFRWWDGTPMTYQNLFGSDNIFHDVEELCVALDDASKLKWRLIECGEFHNHRATICQRGGYLYFCFILLMMQKIYLDRTHWWISFFKRANFPSAMSIVKSIHLDPSHPENTQYYLSY